jgi:uncharacterized NAD(P)/FAD-binding protein YdhS
MSAQKRIAIVGAGPTGIYTLKYLLESEVPLWITLFEREDEAGVGMPYSDEDTGRMMLANIASIEIPPVMVPLVDWIRSRTDEFLSHYGLERERVTDRQFLPRIVLGEYFRDQFLELVRLGRSRGHMVEVRESSEVCDVEALQSGVRLRVNNDEDPLDFDLCAIVTGHVWPEDHDPHDQYYPSPWSGLISATIPAAAVGIMGTSLSAIDAAMAVVARHGEFAEVEDGSLRYDLDEESKGLSIALMSRSGILPEADFYCPLPYEPMRVATEDALERVVSQGPNGLLDRVFDLVAEEISVSDPVWAARVSLSTLDADSFASAYFADRMMHDAFHWAEYNLAEVERNKRDRHTVPWRYAILRLHEIVQEIVPHLDADDRERFDSGLCKVFVDNYAAIPSESVRRLLALRDAGLIDVIALGDDYQMEKQGDRVTIATDQRVLAFEVFIDARGQKPLGTKDLPFPTLRKQVLTAGDEIPDVGDDYTLQAPEIARGKIALGALPYLIHDQPFVQGITASAEIGKAIAGFAMRPSSRVRKRLGAMAA